MIRTFYRTYLNTNRNDGPIYQRYEIEEMDRLREQGWIEVQHWNYEGGLNFISPDATDEELRKIGDQEEIRERCR